MATPRVPAALRSLRDKSARLATELPSSLTAECWGVPRAASRCAAPRNTSWCAEAKSWAPSRPRLPPLAARLFLDRCRPTRSRTAVPASDPSPDGLLRPLCNWWEMGAGSESTTRARAGIVEARWPLALGHGRSALGDERCRPVGRGRGGRDGPAASAQGEARNEDWGAHAEKRVVPNTIKQHQFVLAGV
jgi:hypothetical protein